MELNGVTFLSKALNHGSSNKIKEIWSIPIINQLNMVDTNTSIGTNDEGDAPPGGYNSG